MPLLMYLTVMMPFRICFSNEPVMFSTMYWFEFCIEAVSGLYREKVLLVEW